MRHGANPPRPNSDGSSDSIRSAISREALQDVAAVYAGRGLPQRALTYYELALALYRERRDQEGERRARLKLVQVYKTLGQWRDAEEQLRQAIAFDEAIGSPDLEEDRRELAQIEARARPL